jgi:hypothetical protein
VNLAVFYHSSFMTEIVLYVKGLT